MAMKNISHSPVTEMLSGKYKIWLIIGLVLLPIADLSACIVLWVFGAAGAYWGLPLFMTVFDLLYLLAVVLSNQRFKYAQKLFFVYLIVTIVLLIIWLAKFADRSAVILANTVEAACGLLHVVGIVAVAISYLYASRRFRFGRHIQLALAIIFSAVVLLALVIAYGVLVISDGYFGQGHGNLPLVYAYTGNDECEVTDIVYGRGDSVVVPYEFNGRKVTSVSAKLFTYGYIKSVTLNCDPDVELCEDAEASEINTNIKIYANKKDVDTIKQKLYNNRVGPYNNFYQNLHKLGNNVQPIGLDKDEVYITFDYDRNSHNYAQSVIIPTWYGKKGDSFRLSDIEGVDYVSHSDIDSDDDMYYCYSNCDKKIMSPLSYDGSALDGMTIDKSCNNVPVRFQKIYKVFAGASNDDLFYDTSAFFKSTMVDGVLFDYALTVLDKADELLLPFDRGEAFTRTMQYRPSSSDAYKPFTSLSELLSEGYDNVTITPYWELVKPQVTLSTVTDEADIIYGDDFELTATVTHPLNGGLSLSYEWYDDTQRIGYNSVLQTNSDTAGTRTYTAIVKLSAPNATSLTTGNAAEIKVNVNKRPLTVTWEHKSLAIMGDEAQTYPAESVYDGKQRTIQPRAQNLAYEDYILFTGHTVLDAGTDTVSATLGSYWDEKYYIAEGETYTYTIKPCPVPLTWDDQTEFVYDGKAHNPTAQAYGLSGEELTVLYNGTQTDAGENYTVTAILPNSNYTVDDTSEKSKAFKIKPWTVIATWGPTRLTYSGEAQAPTARATGVNDEVVTLNVTGQQTNANQIGGNVSPIYTATAVSANKNYTVGHGTESTEFTILPYELTVNWTNTTVTYNGQRQLPTATAVGVKNEVVNLTVSVTGFPWGVLSAGDYTATATVADTNYAVKGNSHAFKVNKMAVSVEWGSTTLTYNGSAQTPTATAKGANGENLPLTVSGGRKNVGSGTATAAFTAEQTNYTLTDKTTTFTIQPKVLNLLVNDITIKYGQTFEGTYEITGKVNGDDVTVTYSANYTLDGNGNIPVGEYTLTAELSGVDKGNYMLNVMRSGKLTVTPPPEQTED